MLSLLYYRYKKSGKISRKKGGGLIIRHGRIIRILRYIYNYICVYLKCVQPTWTAAFHIHFRSMAQATCAMYLKGVHRMG